MYKHKKQHNLLKIKIERMRLLHENHFIARTRVIVIPGKNRTRLDINHNSNTWSTTNSF